MDFSARFPIWDKLTPSEQKLLLSSVSLRTAAKGTVVHKGHLDCSGLLLLTSGQLRAYIFSDEGREITVYRLFEHDLCLFSASCIMRSIQFELFIEAEKDTEFWLIPPDVYHRLMEQSVYVANYTNEIMASRFSEVMWLMEQIMLKSMDKRLADFLLQESSIEGSTRLNLTHETIANHLGTHREVVTRLLRYLQNEGMVAVSRGVVELKDEKALQSLS